MKRVMPLLLLAAIGCGGSITRIPSTSVGGDHDISGGWFFLSGETRTVYIRNETAHTISTVMFQDFEKPLTPYHRVKVEIRPGAVWRGPLVPVQRMRMGLLYDWMLLRSFRTFTQAQVGDGMDMIVDEAWPIDRYPFDDWEPSKHLFSDAEWDVIASNN